MMLWAVYPRLQQLSVDTEIDMMATVLPQKALMDQEDRPEHGEQLFGRDLEDSITSSGEPFV